MPSSISTAIDNFEKTGAIALGPFSMVRTITSLGTQKP